MEDKMINALNEQINRELFSSYLYFSMASWSEANNLKGASHWLKNQAHEEMLHVVKMYDYVNDRDGRVKMEAIEKPKTDWKSVEDIFDDVLAHEKQVTSHINDLLTLALELKDHAAQSFLQWFVNEQVEEESTVRDIIDQIKLISGAPAGMYMLDKELGTRVAPTIEP